MLIAIGLKARKPILELIFRINMIKLGKTIRKIEEMMSLKSVYVVCWRKRIPVAFLQNMQTRIIYNLIKNKMVKK